MAGDGAASLKVIPDLSHNTEKSKCPRGFIWNAVEKLCVDVDECAFDAPCQHQCVNKVGGFECRCPSGYVLNEARNCIGIKQNYVLGYVWLDYLRWLFQT